VRKKLEYLKNSMNKVQGDQKVSVHLMITIQNSGVQTLFDHPVHTLHTMKWGQVKWISHIWRRNCLIKHAIEGNIKGRMDVKRVRGRRRKQLLYDLFRQGEDGGNFKRKHLIALCGELILERAKGIS